MLCFALPDPFRKMEHYPIFQKVLPDLCRFDTFALPDLRPIFQFSPARDLQENKVQNNF